MRTLLAVLKTGNYVIYLNAGTRFMNFRHSQQVSTEQYGGQTESLRRRNYARKGLEHGRAESCSGVALCSL